MIVNLCQKTRQIIRCQNILLLGIDQNLSIFLIKSPLLKACAATQVCKILTKSIILNQHIDISPRWAPKIPKIFFSFRSEGIQFRIRAPLESYIQNRSIWRAIICQLLGYYRKIEKIFASSFTGGYQIVEFLLYIIGCFKFKIWSRTVVFQGSMQTFSHVGRQKS